VEGRQLNIILVTGATARARTITLDWRHWMAGSVSLLALFLVFTLMFNFVTLKWAAAVNHPLLQASSCRPARRPGWRSGFRDT
jgi:hypothetical protein